MNNRAVRNYLIQDLDKDEKQSYVEYINGDFKSTKWIEKTSERRDKLLLLDLKCNKYYTEGGSAPNNIICCNSYVSIEETGICKCSNGHTCYAVVIDAINNLIPT
jgi:hypothetical protein